VGALSNAIPTAAELNALREQLRIPIYELAPPCRVNPGRLGQMLARRAPMPLAIARRLERALAAELAAIREAVAR
jgi:hypothetical protein